MSLSFGVNFDVSFLSFKLELQELGSCTEVNPGYKAVIELYGHAGWQGSNHSIPLAQQEALLAFLPNLC